MNKDLKVIFMGTPFFAVPVLEMLNLNTQVCLVVTQPDKLVGRGKKLTYSPVKEYALKNNIPVFQPRSLKDEAKTILNTPCDIIITCAYGQIIPDVILNYPKYKCINVHASLLPKYRGGAPIHWCLINGEEKTGITIMYMSNKLDAGDIIKEEEYVILPEDNVSTLHEKLSQLGANLLKESLKEIILKTNQRIKQDENKATYARVLKRSDEHLDFSLEGQKIINKIRGLNAWPLANFNLNDKECKVIEAYFVKEKCSLPNKIVDIKKDAIGISCQDGIIYLTKIKPFGKNIMDVKSYLNGVVKEKLYEATIS